MSSRKVGHEHGMKRNVSSACEYPVKQDFFGSAYNCTGLRLGAGNFQSSAITSPGHIESIKSQSFDNKHRSVIFSFLHSRRFRSVAFVWLMIVISRLATTQRRIYPDDPNARIMGLSHNRSSQVGHRSLVNKTRVLAIYHTGNFL